MKLALRRLLPPWILYVALGVAVIFFLAILYGWLWVIRDAEVLLSDEGITIYDARSRPELIARDSAGGAKDLGRTVDNVYSFLRRCIPLLAEDESAMKDVSLVFVSPESLQVLAILSLAPHAAALYSANLKRIYVTESGDIAHEWIHHYLYIRKVAHTHSRKNHAFEHPLFVRCESPASPL